MRRIVLVVFLALGCGSESGGEEGAHIQDAGLGAVCDPDAKGQCGAVEGGWCLTDPWQGGICVGPCSACTEGGTGVCGDYPGHGSTCIQRDPCMIPDPTPETVELCKAKDGGV